MRDMNIKTKTRLLWFSAIGSTILSIPCLFAICFEIYVYFTPNWFVFWHDNSSPTQVIEIIFGIVLWFSFPILYLWLRGHRTSINRKTLFKYGAYSNAALIVLPIINILLLFILDSNFNS